MKRGRELDAELLYSVHRCKVGVVEVIDGAAENNLPRLADVIRSDHACVEGADAPPLPIIAPLEVDALGGLVSEVHRAAVVEPVDQSLGVYRDFVCRLVERSQHNVLERRTQLRRRILSRTELRVRVWIDQVLRGHKREAEGGIVERAIRRIVEPAQDAVDLDDVVSGLDVQAGEKIAGRRVVESDRPVDGLFGIEDPMFGVGEIPHSDGHRGIAAWADRKSAGSGSRSQSLR